MRTANSTVFKCIVHRVVASHNWHSKEWELGVRLRQYIARTRKKERKRPLFYAATSYSLSQSQWLSKSPSVSLRRKWRRRRWWRWRLNEKMIWISRRHRKKAHLIVHSTWTFLSSRERIDSSSNNGATRTSFHKRASNRIFPDTTLFSLSLPPSPLYTTDRLRLSTWSISSSLFYSLLSGKSISRDKGPTARHTHTHTHVSSWPLPFCFFIFPLDFNLFDKK